MADIIHRVGIAGSVHDVYRALTTNEGLSRWWTRDTSGAGELGSVIHFRFGGVGPDFKVAELKPDSVVRWAHSGNMPDAWMGTEVSFELTTRTAKPMCCSGIQTGKSLQTSWATAAPNGPCFY